MDTVYLVSKILDGQPVAQLAGATQEKALELAEELIAMDARESDGSNRPRVWTDIDWWKVREGDYVIVLIGVAK